MVAILDVNTTNTNWTSVVDTGAVAATVINDAAITASSSTVTSASASFASWMNGMYFYLFGAGPVLVSAGDAWDAHPLIGTFTYVNATTGTLSTTATTTVTGGELVIGPDCTAAFQIAIDTGHAIIPVGTSFMLTGEPFIGSHQGLHGFGPGDCRLFVPVAKANGVTSAWATEPTAEGFSVYGNGFGAQPSNTDPGENVTPNWANAGCGVIFARATGGRIEGVNTYFCGGDGVTANRNGIAGVYVTMGCIETKTADCRTEFCRNGINEDNFFSGVGQLWNPLANTFDRNTTNFNRFGFAIDSGSLSRGASVTNHVARYNVLNGVEVHSSNYATITNPRCEFNGRGTAGASGIQIYGTSNSILANYVTVVGAECHTNGTHGIKVSDHVSGFEIIGGSMARNGLHGLYFNNAANDGFVIGSIVRDNGQDATASVDNHDGIKITDCQRIHILARVLDDQAAAGGATTHNYGIRAIGTSDDIVIADGTYVDNVLQKRIQLVGSSSRVAGRTRASIVAKAQGLAGEAFPLQATGTSFAFGAGSQRAALVGLFAGETITNIYFDVTTAGSGVTLAKVAVWDSTGTLLANSADLSSQFTSGTGHKGGALSTAYTVPADGGYYIGGVMVSGTPPTIHGPSGATASAYAVPPAVANSGKTDVGALTITASGTTPWVGWS